MEFSGGWGKVTAVYAKAHAVDVVMNKDARQLSAVTVLCGMVSTASGSVDLHTPGAPSKPYDVQNTEGLNIWAAVAMFADLPVVIGFKAPELGEMTFDRVNFKITRHPSDVYTSIDDDGNVEVFHPSGTYLRIGEATAHEDLTGQDFDKRFAIKRNMDKAPHVFLAVRNGGEAKVSLDLKPDGGAALIATGDVDVTGQGNLTAVVQGTAHIESVGDATFKAPKVTLDTAEVAVTGKITAEGDIVSTSGDVKAGNISLKNHKHTSAAPGSPTSPSIP